MPNVNSNALTTGTLASSAVTANQVILTYTVPAGKIFNMLGASLNVRLTTFAATATNFGTASFRVNGTAKNTFTVVAGPGVLNSPLYLDFPQPLPFAPGDVLTIVCTPAAATAMTWDANLVGFES